MDLWHGDKLKELHSMSNHTVDLLLLAFAAFVFGWNARGYTKR